MRPKTRAPAARRAARHDVRFEKANDAEYHKHDSARNIPRVEITIDGYGDRGALCNVRLAGLLIVTRSADPEFDAARALLERGLSGPFETIGADGQPRMRFASIEIAARWCMSDERRDGPRLRRWDAGSDPDSASPARVSILAG